MTRRWSFQEAQARRELLPAEYRYADGAGLPEELERLCRAWTAGRLDLRTDRRTVIERFRASSVLPRYRELFEELVAQGRDAARR